MRPQGRTLSRCPSSETPRDEVSIGITQSTCASTGGRAPPPEFQISRLSSNPNRGPLPSTLTHVFTTHGGHPSACPGLLQVILSRSTAPSPDLSVGLLLHLGVLACASAQSSLWLPSPQPASGELLVTPSWAFSARVSRGCLAWKFRDLVPDGQTQACISKVLWHWPQFPHL